VGRANFSRCPNTTPIIRHPNFYEVHGDGIYVTYATTGTAGSRQFSYQDTNLSKSFSGEEIRIVETEVGALVTVTIALTVDLGSTTFTLFVPRINLSFIRSSYLLLLLWLSAGFLGKSLEIGQPLLKFAAVHIEDYAANMTRTMTGQFP